MKQEPVVEQLLPLSAEKMQAGPLAPAASSGWDYIYEPDAQTVIDDLLLRYVEALVYQAVAENMASEQSARMVAMKAATDNAGNVINELKLVYNKTRQAAITKELSEIVAVAPPSAVYTRIKFLEQNMAQVQGKIVQCIGAVVDVEFPRDQMPKVYDALKMEGSALTLEVQQQLGDGIVRTIALGSSDGLRRGMMVYNTNNPITVPVGKATLGRIMDVLGNPIDERGPVSARARLRRPSTARPRPTTS
jgi:hypothetical protein